MFRPLPNKKFTSGEVASALANNSYKASGMSQNSASPLPPGFTPRQPVLSPS